MNQFQTLQKGDFMNPLKPSRKQLAALQTGHFVSLRHRSGTNLWAKIIRITRSAKGFLIDATAQDEVAGIRRGDPLSISGNQIISL